MKPGKANHDDFGPLFGADSRILILGSFPSIKSREAKFFYGHPQNRFWKVMSLCFEGYSIDSVENKKRLILENGLALYDSLYSCTITGSSDSSIKDVVPADLNQILDNARIKRIVLNGKASAKYFFKYQKVNPSIEVVTLPSTSAANASVSLEKLVEAWKPYLK